MTAQPGNLTATLETIRIAANEIVMNLGSPNVIMRQVLTIERELDALKTPAAPPIPAYDPSYEFRGAQR